MPDAPLPTWRQLVKIAPPALSLCFSSADRGFVLLRSEFDLLMAVQLETDRAVLAKVYDRSTLIPSKEVQIICQQYILSRLARYCLLPILSCLSAGPDFNV